MDPVLGCRPHRNSATDRHKKRFTSMRRIYLLPGIDDTRKRMKYFQQELSRAGYPDAHLLEITPNDGSISIESMATQVLRQIEKTEKALPAGKEIGVIGYSMGGLVFRYIIQRLGGKDLFQAFISIATPHHGTATAYLRRGEGVRQMRPGSKLLRELNGDPNSWGSVKVYSFWTPLDLMVIPSGSSKLSCSTNKRFLVLCHPCMTHSNRVAASIIHALDETGRKSFTSP
jgi:triacylglycerol lipase